MMNEVKPVVERDGSALSVMLCVAMAMVLLSLAWPSAAAATIVVNSLADTVVSGDGVCTLREAILNAERDNHSGATDCHAGSGDDTITFSLSGTINLDSNLGILRVDSAGGLTIDGGGRITITCLIGEFGPCVVGPVLSVGSLGVLTLKNVTVSGSGHQSTGVIINDGIMTISHSTVRDGSSIASGHFEDNPPIFRRAGGIFNGGTMTISHSAISNNRVESVSRVKTVTVGSGIYNHGILTISHSTVSDNFIGGDHEGAQGGGLYNDGTLTITNSTVTGNRGGFPVGTGIYNEGTLAISSGTISNNIGDTINDTAIRGSIFNTGTVKMSATLIADGCSGPITSLGYNLDQTGSCGLTGPDDKSNIDPRLDPAGLKDHGGPTKTIALCTGAGTPAGCTGKSPAIDAVPLAHCIGAGGEPLGLDQREYFRPADGDRNGTSLCDMGAFEAGSKPLQTINSLITFTPLPATYHTSRETTGCPAGYVGKFHFTADLTNQPGSPPLSHLVAEVASLTKGNVVLNADGGLGGDGATVTFSSSGQYTDGVLMAKEHVALPMTLCLRTFTPFTFFVDVLGTH